MIIPRRYVVRMFNIPDNITKGQFEDYLFNHRLKYRKMFFASSNGHLSAGFAFIEFDDREQMNIFKSYFHNVNDDISYNYGKQYE